MDYTGYDETGIYEALKKSLLEQPEKWQPDIYTLRKGKGSDLIELWIDEATHVEDFKVYAPSYAFINKNYRKELFKIAKNVYIKRKFELNLEKKLFNKKRILQILTTKNK